MSRPPNQVVGKNVMRPFKYLLLRKKYKEMVQGSGGYKKEEKATQKFYRTSYPFNYDAAFKNLIK